MIVTGAIGLPTAELAPGVTDESLIVTFRPVMFGAAAAGVVIIARRAARVAVTIG